MQISNSLVGDVYLVSVARIASWWMHDVFFFFFFFFFLLLLLLFCFVFHLRGLLWLGSAHVKIVI